MRSIASLTSGSLQHLLPGQNHVLITHTYVRIFYGSEVCAHVGDSSSQRRAEHLDADLQVRRNIDVNDRSQVFTDAQSLRSTIGCEDLRSIIYINVASDLQVGI